MCLFLLRQILQRDDHAGHGNVARRLLAFEQLHRRFHADEANLQRILHDQPRAGSVFNGLHQKRIRIETDIFHLSRLSMGLNGLVGANRARLVDRENACRLRKTRQQVARLLTCAFDGAIRIILRQNGDVRKLLLDRFAEALRTTVGGGGIRNILDQKDFATTIQRLAKKPSGIRPARDIVGRGKGVIDVGIRGGVDDHAWNAFLMHFFNGAHQRLEVVWAEHDGIHVLHQCVANRLDLLFAIGLDLRAIPADFHAVLLAGLHGALPHDIPPHVDGAFGNHRDHRLATSVHIGMLLQMAHFLDDAQREQNGGNRQ